MKKQGRIFVTGDIHGNPIQSLSTKNFSAQKELTKNDVVIILGDFGLFWSYRRTREESYFLKWLDDRNFTTCFIDGNHENADLLDNLQEKELYGNRVGIASHSIFHLKRGIVYRINGRKILTLGGAHSHDRVYRKWGESMWTQEEITDRDIKKAEKAIQDVGFEVDYIMTHCAPIEYAKYAMPKDMMGDYMPDGSEEQLSILKNTSGVEFKKWLFGHYHTNTTDPFMGQWQCLYHNVVEI